MTTRKIVFIIAGAIGVLVLIVSLFVGGIFWFVFHAIGSSEAADTARTYLRDNQVLKQDIGQVKDFGYLVTGNMNVSNGDGEATLYLKVIGEKRNAQARVDLAFRGNRSWRVTGASYDRDGRRVDLMRAYEPTVIPTIEASPDKN